jgi:acyl-CoA hydrolase
VRPRRCRGRWPSAWQLHQSGTAFQVKLLSGASTGAAVDDELAGAEAVSWRAPYITSAPMRELANTGKLEAGPGRPARPRADGPRPADH